MHAQGNWAPATITADPSVMGNKFVGISPAIRLYLHVVMSVLKYCKPILEGGLARPFRQADIDRIKTEETESWTTRQTDSRPVDQKTTSQADGKKGRMRTG